ncbi:PstS family phosphate ABC transporter substrate-binding protein [uncultured Gemmobacter sp.]|uniref:PstS family phosphate ABC transporter substrate-binding protein n=1 Tax=uncultured Gemmobacter sp. TaxID=1095917 RepID=UPI002594C135|nr:PstS family phosphate ABC transporter substrate-binding protein [uncultured Gemmobacter sp.]
MTKTLTFVTAASLLAFQAAAQDATVTVDGSSTVFPISEAMAEEFQNATGTRVTVGSSGTGGGFKKFCRGETDITGASRPIRGEEIELCKTSGIEYIELPVAMDGLAVIVNPANDWAACMSVEELKTMWEVAAQDKVKNWNQANPAFPDAPLNLFGAGTDSGTYDYFTLAINGVEHESRGDYTATEDDNITINGVAGDVNALGFLGLAYLEENRDKVKDVAIKQADGSCVEATVETAGDGSYQPLARPLFMYVSKAALDRPEVQAYADFMMDPKHGTELVAEVGYVPLPEKAFELGKAKVAARKTGTFFEGGSKIGVSIEELLASE